MQQSHYECAFWVMQKTIEHSWTQACPSTNAMMVGESSMG